MPEGQTRNPYSRGSCPRVPGSQPAAAPRNNDRGEERAMLTIEPTGAVLGAVARGIDLAAPLGDDDFARILLALGRHGVLRFPDQHLDLADLKRFSERFGEIQGSPTRDPDARREFPEIDI